MERGVRLVHACPHDAIVQFFCRDTEQVIAGLVAIRKNTYSMAGLTLKGAAHTEDAFTV